MKPDGQHTSELSAASWCQLYRRSEYTRFRKKAGPFRNGSSNFVHHIKHTSLLWNMGLQTYRRVVMKAIDGLFKDFESAEKGQYETL